MGPKRSMGSFGRPRFEDGKILLGGMVLRGRVRRYKVAAPFRQVAQPIRPRYVPLSTLAALPAHGMIKRQTLIDDGHALRLSGICLILPQENGQLPPPL